MGKKTDAMLKTLETRSNSCTQTANMLIQLLAEWEKIQAEWDRWEDELRQDLDWEKNHPYGKRRIAAFEKGKAGRAKLRNDVNQLNHAIQDFSTFITKKEKSKNPFKSKASLPGAKKMLKMYQDVTKDYETIISATSKAIF